MLLTKLFNLVGVIKLYKNTCMIPRWVLLECKTTLGDNQNRSRIFEKETKIHEYDSASKNHSIISSSDNHLASSELLWIVVPIWVAYQKPAYSISCFYVPLFLKISLYIILRSSIMLWILRLHKSINAATMLQYFLPPFRKWLMLYFYQVLSGITI